MQLQLRASSGAELPAPACQISYVKLKSELVNKFPFLSASSWLWHG